MGKFEQQLKAVLLEKPFPADKADALSLALHQAEMHEGYELTEIEDLLWAEMTAILVNSWTKA